MTVGPDRATAMRRMRRALDEVVVTGIQTTLPFDRHLLRDPGFLSGEDLAIDWVDRHWDGEADRAARRAAGARIAMAAVDAAGDRPPGASLRTDTSVSSGRWAMAAREDGVDRWPR
jgi:acetyl/propionyl-CoA carboxylase alpha subunit